MSLNNTIITIQTIDDLSCKNIIKPNIQRVIDHSKVEDIIQFQLEYHKQHNHFNFSAAGAINIHILDNIYYLVDGQHRLEALQKLYQDYSHIISFYVLWVEVDTWENLENNYNMINKNTPLPDFSCFQNINKCIPEETASFFQTKYLDVWSRNSRARRPHVFFNYFQEALAFICERAEIKSIKELQKLVEDYNKVCKDWSITSFKNINDSVYKTAKEKGFFLGLFPYQNEDYRYEWAKRIVERQTGVPVKKSITTKKKRIPKKIKNDSWDKYIGKDIACELCICCKTTKIYAKDFIAGHIISEYNGGDVTVDNIMPICSGCNLSMSTENMRDFIENHYPKNLQQFQDCFKQNENSSLYFS